MKWTDTTWLPVCNELGLGGEALTFSVNPVSGKLYVGGSFKMAGRVLVDGLACWNGSGWTAIEGNPNSGKVNGEILAIAHDHSGNLYILGFAEGSNYIKKLSGSVSSTVCDLADFSSGAQINAIALDSIGNLYVGGRFDTVLGVVASNVAKWDGSTWSPLGNGIANTPDEYDVVSTLAIDANGNVYAGGSFSIAGGIKAHNIAKWNGKVWIPLGEGIIDSTDKYFKIVTLGVDHTGNLYAAGSFNQIGGVMAHNIAKWDGSSWNSLGAGLYTNEGSNARVFTIAFDRNGTLYAGGSFTSAGDSKARNIALWDGTAWSSLGSGICLNRIEPADMSAVKTLICTGENKLYAGGDFAFAGDAFSACFAQCDISTTSIGLTRKVNTTSQVFSYDHVKGYVHVNCGAASVVNVGIYSLNGREVNQYTITMNQGSHILKPNVKHLPNAIYLTRITMGNSSVQYRIVNGGQR
jgi:hypothetical protein